MKTGPRTTATGIDRRARAANVSVDDIVHDLAPDVVTCAARRSEEISKAARVTQKDLELQVSM